MLIDDFKVVIKAKKVPVNINNKVVQYIKDSSLQNSHLYCEIFYKNNSIAKGIILDFYKKFEILQDFNQNYFTHILTFEYNNKEYQKYTVLGNKLYKMKYFKNPSISKEEKEQFIDDIIFYFNGYIKYLKNNYKNLTITFIPSASNIPNELADKLSKINKIPLKNIISKKTSQSSKNITNISLQKLNKYDINFSKLNPNDIFILIDDIMGTTASICEIMLKLYNFNKKINFFFIPVKDVKR